MRMISGIKEKYKDRLIISIFDRLSHVCHEEWKEIAIDNDELAETINAIMSDIRNLRRGKIASHLRDNIPPRKKNQDLFNRKASASIRRIKSQTAELNKQLFDWNSLPDNN